MILVVGRPGLDGDGELHGPAGRIALAAAEAGGRVELVGSVGDDAAGEQVALALGKAGIGHAALLRDPAGTTPRGDDSGGSPPRLDAADVELGLSYLVECRVIVLAEVAGEEVQRVTRAAAAYHAAQLVELLAPGQQASGDVPPRTTVLEAPEADDGAFAALVGRYAARLAAGDAADAAWQSAVRSAGWERAEPDEG